MIDLSVCRLHSAGGRPAAEPIDVMSIVATIRESFERSFVLYRDLVDSIPPEALTSKLPGIPSNTLGEQLWCVIGARESYRRAIEAGEWSGFSCSLKSTTDKAMLLDALHQSAEALKNDLDKAETFTDQQNRLLIDLLEHEIAHHGQLIRYLYGMKLTIPESWKSRYALN